MKRKRKRDLPNPLDATSVAIKIGDFPVRNSTYTTRGEIQKIEVFKSYREIVILGLTSQYPFSLLLLFIAMDTHGRPAIIIWYCNTQVLIGINRLCIRAGSYPSRRSRRVNSSTFFFVSTNIMVYWKVYTYITYSIHTTSYHETKSITQDENERLCMYMYDGVPYSPSVPLYSLAACSFLTWRGEVERRQGGGGGRG